MEIENHLNLPTLTVLMESIIVKEKIKHLNCLKIKIDKSSVQKKRVCGGTAVSKESEKIKEYEITLTCKTKGILPRNFLRVFLDVFLHEIGHVWDSQQHGTAHWRYDMPWKDRPQELIAENFMNRKLKMVFHTYPRMIKDIRQELREERKKIRIREGKLK